MAEKKITTYGPNTSKAIKNYVFSQLGVVDAPQLVNGVIPSNQFCFAKVGIANFDISPDFILHAWVEVRFNIETGVWDEVPDGRLGTVENDDDEEAVNFNCLINSANLNYELEKDTIVLARKFEDPETRENYWAAEQQLNLMFEITAITNNFPDPNEYTGKIWLNYEWDEEPLAIDKTAVNSWEDNNNSTSGCGYPDYDTLVEEEAECGDLYGLMQLKVGQAVPIVGKRRFEDMSYYVISERLPPLIKGPD